MALVTVSGLPSSGRSMRSHQIKKAFEEQIRNAPSTFKSQLPHRVVIVSDDDIHIPRSAYASQRSEKPARASYLSAVTRAMGKDTIVIADGGAGLNIKGFRYQLWCAAREVGVKCLTVHVHVPPALCTYWNNVRRSSSPDSSYDDDTLTSLFMRYEEPNAMTRWDSPLFLLPSILLSSPDSSTITPSNIQTDPLPTSDLWAAATQGSAHKAPEVVQPTRSTTTSYLSLLESSTRHVLSLILDHTATLGFQPGSTIPLTSPTLQGPTQLYLTIPGDKPTLASLQRLRRHFVKIHNAGSAAINELGNAAREEGGHVAGSNVGVGKASKGQPAAAAATPEYLVARRFVAWLEEAM